MREICAREGKVLLRGGLTKDNYRNVHKLVNKTIEIFYLTSYKAIAEALNHDDLPKYANVLSNVKSIPFARL
jgi:hypothetical protein